MSIDKIDKILMISVSTINNNNMLYFMDKDCEMWKQNYDG